jgi:biotin carboxyl carrier protein
MFNEIESDRLGMVTCVLVENSQPIEYNQPAIDGHRIVQINLS